MIRLQPRVLDDIDTVAGLRSALQLAVELEHATIPPYLYAYWSFSDTDGQIPGIIYSVVIEEMGHMALAGNLLNAVGGNPSIDDPSFIPTYPGPLPGGVESGLRVGLAPFSIDVVEKVFMEIEEPEERVGVGGAPPDPGPEGLTIGQFYSGILGAIEQLGDSIFTGDPSLQVTNQDGPAVSAVTGMASARDAIATIIDQGEGSAQSPLEAAGSDTAAHYYRFAEIAAGHALKLDGDKWNYDGEAIPFDPSDVLPLPANPHASDYSGDELTAINTFNGDYTKLLGCLHDVFNGSPGNLGTAIGYMDQLTTDVAALTALKLGPTFEYYKPPS